MPTRPSTFRPATGPGSDADRRERARAADRKRMAESATRALYGTSRWQAQRLAQLKAEPLCRMCLAEDSVTAATVCDHIEPHRGDIGRFWAGPFQSLCRYHHDVTKQREERGSVAGGRGV